jgi:hypothetical protein
VSDRDVPRSPARRRWVAIGIAAAVPTIVLLVVTDIPVLTILGAVLLGVVILGVGWFFLRQLATPPPPAPAPGTLRKVKLTYRCEMCGAEVRMVSAASEDPEPPRHCMEEMELVATADDAL